MYGPLCIHKGFSVLLTKLHHCGIPMSDLEIKLEVGNCITWLNKSERDWHIVGNMFWITKTGYFSLLGFTQVLTRIQDIGMTSPQYSSAELTFV